MDEHIKQIRRAYGARAWILRRLTHENISPTKLIEAYCSLVPPVLEYPAVAFHSMLTEEASDSLERLQRLALKSIYGLDRSYADCLEHSGLPTLAARREKLLLDFAVKIWGIVVPKENSVRLCIEKRR